MDLGTGSGYLAFPIAESYTDCEIIGLDIVVNKPGGQLFISDPTPNEDDTMRFVDTFMQLSKDGHVQFYSKDEFEMLEKKLA